MPTPSNSKKPKTQQTDPAELDERIRRRAYELYEHRNRTERHEMESRIDREENQDDSSIIAAALDCAVPLCYEEGLLGDCSPIRRTL